MITPFRHATRVRKYISRIRMRSVQSTCSYYFHSIRGYYSSPYSLSSNNINKLINEGKLREINAFNSEVTQLSMDDFDTVLEAYSLSLFVNIPAHHIPLNQLNSINTEILEKMLTTSLLCNYRSTAITLATELYQRYQDNNNSESFIDFISFGQCILTFYQNNQLSFISKNTNAMELYKYLTLNNISLSIDITPATLNAQVLNAVLLSWIQDENISEVIYFINYLMDITSITSSSSTNDVTEADLLSETLTQNPDLLYEVIKFLRCHGHYDTCHRLLSILKHKLQWKIFDENSNNSNKSKQYYSDLINKRIHNWITFSKCLQDKEDIKYLKSIVTFYKQNVMKRRHYTNRFVDIERIFESMVHASRHVGSEYDRTNFINNQKHMKKIITTNHERAWIGYQFFEDLRVIENKWNRLLVSDKAYTQVALLVGQLHPAVRPARSPSSNNTRSHNARNNNNDNKISNSDMLLKDKRLVLLKKLKDEFTFKYKHSQMSHSKHVPSSLSFISHKYFYTAYIQSLQTIFKSSNSKCPKTLQEKYTFLNDVLDCMRKTGHSFGYTREFSRGLVEFFISSSLSIDNNLKDKGSNSLLKESIKDLLHFIKNNNDCFHFNFISKKIIILLCDRNYFNQTYNNSLSQSIHENPNYEEQDILFCSLVSNRIRMFLNLLLDNQSIESIHLNAACSDSFNLIEDTPIQHYRSFKHCTNKEWDTIFLLQVTVEQLLNLNHSNIIPTLLSILSILASLQLVTNRYWEQAIQICVEWKKWDDLQVLIKLLLYQGKMIQHYTAHAVVSAYFSTENPHIAYRIFQAMNREGIIPPAEAYRALCVALGRSSHQRKHGLDYSVLAEKTFQQLLKFHGPIAFSGNFDTSRGADLVRQRTEWLLNGQNENKIKEHLKDCDKYITSNRELQAIFEDILVILPSTYFEAGGFLITTLLSRGLCIPSNADIDRFIDAAIASQRLTLAASMLRTFRHLKENFHSINDIDIGNSGSTFDTNE